LSFNKYLNQLRINKAKELMKDPTLRIKEIAYMVGYENARYFIRVFRSFTGLSPNIYKEQL
jgi:two-component system response regulator YesN